MLKELQENLEMKINNHQQYDFKEHLQNSSNQDRRFSFAADYRQVIADLKESKDELLTEFENKFIVSNSTLYQEIRQYLKEDQSNWEQNRNLLNKMKILKDKEKKISPQTKEKIRNVITKSKDIYNKLVTHLEKLALIRQYNDFYQYLTEKLALLKHNFRVLERDKLRYKAKLKQLGQIPRGECETLIYGKDKSECDQFAQKMLSPKYNLDLYRIEEEINREFVPDLVAAKLEPEKLEWSELFSCYEEQLDEEQTKDSICSYLAELSTTERKKQMEKLIVNSCLFGQLREGENHGEQSQSEVENETVSHQQIITGADKKLIKTIVQELSASRIKVGPAKFKRKTQLTLITLDTALPLWRFEELHQAQKDYFNGINKASNPQLTKQMFHTNDQFINIEEPFGTTSQISEGEVVNYINLLLHTQVMKIENVYEKDGYVKYRVEGNNYQYLLDKKTNESKILFSEFVEKITSRHDWFNHFTGLLLKLFIIHFLTSYQTKEEQEKYEEYLKSYFSLGTNTPYFPQVVISKMKLVLSNQLARTEEEKISKALQLTQQFLEQEQISSQTKTQQNDLCHSIAEVYQIYDRPQVKIDF